MRTARFVGALLAAWAAVAASAEDAAPLVLTGTQATYSLTVALTA
jgi:hypothetical protein